MGPVGRHPGRGRAKVDPPPATGHRTVAGEAKVGYDLPPDAGPLGPRMLQELPA